jgi:hypothetical protein
LTRGAHPGFGWILLLGSEAKALDKSRSDHSLTFVGPNTVTVSNLIITDVRTLTAERWDIDNNAAVMIQLQDIRYKCWMISMNEGYNVTTPNAEGTKLYTTGSNSKYYRTSTAFTWSTMVADIASKIPVTVSVANADFPNSLPENYQFRGVSCMEALSKIACDTGHLITLNRAGTELSFITGGHTETQPDYKPWLADFNGGESLGTITDSRPHPAKIKVYFPKQDYAFQGGETGEPHWNDLYLNEPLHEEEVDVASLASFPTGAPILSGTSDTLHSNLLARFSETGAFLNESEVQNAAIDLANNYFPFKASDDDAGIVRGAWPILLDSTICKVGWYDTGGGLHTKVGEERGDPTLLQPVFSSREVMGRAASMLPASPPHLGVGHETTHRWGIATLSGPLEQDESVNGVVQYGTWNTAGGNDQVDWASSGNTIRIYNSFPVTYESGDRVYVVYHRQVGRWLCLAPVESGSTLIRFKMKTKLPLGGKGIAIEIETGPAYTEVGSQFPIKDPWTNPGAWRDDTDDGQGNEGSYMGWCLIPNNPEIADGQFGTGGQFEDQPFREIVWMEQIARSITFTSNNDTQQGNAPEDPWQISAAADNYYLGKNPGDVFGSNFAIYDPQHLFPNIMEGSKGKARYNDRDHRYEIVNVNQMAFVVEAELLTSLCPEDATASIAGGSVKIASFAPFGMEPDISTALNLFKLCAPAESKVWLMWSQNTEDPEVSQDPDTGFWIVIQVEHQEISVIIDHRIVLVNGDPDCCQHQIKRLNLCAMSCDDPDEIEWEIVPGPDDCCQEEPPVGCCGCEPFPMTGTTVLEAVMTGAQEGSGDIPQSGSLPEGVCAQFEGTVTFPTSPCLGLSSQVIKVTCYEATGILEVDPLQIAGGICNADLDSITVDECNPFKATIKYKLSETIFGGCDPCNENDEITLVLTEKEP